jgi:hypothetical protein
MKPLIRQPVIPCQDRRRLRLFRRDQGLIPLGPGPTLKAKVFNGSADVTPATAKVRLATLKTDAISRTDLPSQANLSERLAVQNRESGERVAPLFYFQSFEIQNRSKLAGSLITVTGLS